MNLIITKISAGLGRPFFVWLLLAMLPMATVLGAGDINVNVTYMSLGAGQTVHGYFDHRFVITNRSLEKSHQVELRFGEYNGAPLAQLSRAVLIGPGASATVSIYQPALRMEWNRVQVIVDGKLSDIDVGVATAGHASNNYYGRQNHACVMVSRAFGSGFIDNGAAANVFAKNGSPYSSPPTGAGPAPSTTAAIVSELPVDSWPSDWLAYTRFDAIVIVHSEWPRLSSNARDALTRYVEMGGNLIVKGDRSVLPEAWNQAFKAGNSNWISLGFGCVGSLNWEGNSAGVLPPTSKLWPEMAHHWSLNSLTFSNTKNAVQANNDFPVIEKITIPARSLLVLVVVFTLVVGPLNMFLLGRYDRKIWLYWTIPTISLIASGMVFCFAFFSEGWSGQARTAGITLLDQTNQHASTLACTAYYFPLQPSKGLSFSRDAELTIQEESFSHNNNSSSKTVDWTDVQHLTSGWVSSRVPAHFVYRKSETRRERVVVTDNGAGNVTLQNSLGVPITMIYVRTATGALYSATNIAAGATATASPDTLHTNKPDAERLRRIFLSASWYNAPNENNDKLWACTPDGGYAAILDGNPFVEDASSNLKRHRKASLVIGINAPTPMQN